LAVILPFYDGITWQPEGHVGITCRSSMHW